MVLLQRGLASLGVPLLVVAGAIGGCAASPSGCDAVCLVDAGAVSYACEGTVWVGTSVDSCSGRQTPQSRIDCATLGLRCVASHGCGLPCASDVDCPAGSYCDALFCRQYLQDGGLCAVDAEPRCPPGQQCVPGPPGGAGGDSDAGWLSGLGWCR